MRRVLSEPLFWIATNAGHDGRAVIDQVRAMPEGAGLNALTGEFGDLIEAGVIDPVRVTRLTIENAASVAALLLTTEADRGRGADRAARRDHRARLRRPRGGTGTAVVARVADPGRAYQMLVGGEWVDARSGETFETVDPYTARPWATLPRAGPEDVDAAVARARRAFDDGPWRRAPGKERARLLRRLAELVEEHALEIATIEVTDNGKLLREMEQQLRGLPDYLLLLGGRRGQDRRRDDPRPTARTG